ncbi:hypothetical protein [Janthinobacterium sp. HLX7-2]|uniref:hypothetical protein n=1 Tax=Janthinobacterium sp. HLX7-2 TaxID=1259331 RepID=UPI003F27A971
MIWRKRKFAFACLALTLPLAGCGGDIAPQGVVPRAAVLPLVTAAAEPAKAARAPLSVGYVEYQASGGLHAYAAVQVLLELEQMDVKNPALELQVAGRPLGRIALARPLATGAHYGTRHWSATIPAAWAIKGVRWRAVADSHDASAPRAIPLAD